MKKGILIKEDGGEIAVVPMNGKKFSLKELQSMVGGYIEITKTCDGRIMVVNDDLKKQSFNEKATKLFWQNEHCLPHSRLKIVGDVLVADKILID